jgi:hypothetical protein
MNDINFSKKTTQIGNVTFIDTYVNSSLLNSPCWLESQSANFAQLIQINNSAAISFYTNETNFHMGKNVSSFKIPLFINSQTNKPTVFPY